MQAQDEMQAEKRRDEIMGSGMYRSHFIFLVAVFVLLTVFLSYSWMSPEITAPNERSRIYLTLGMLESGSISITDQVEQFGRPYDVAKRGESYFSDKAPGSSVLAIPAFFGYRLLGGDMDSIEAMTVFARQGVMLPFALLSLIFFWLLMRRIGVPRSTATAMTVVLALGTNFVHYGAAFFGHAMVLCFSLAGAYCLIRGAITEDAPAGRRWLFAAAGLTATTFTIEYQAVVLCVGFATAVLAVPKFRNISFLTAAAAGAAIPAGLVLCYNFAAFGDPLSTSYGFLVHPGPKEAHEAGLFGVTIPSWEATYGLLFSPSRGLMMCAPLLLFGIAGLKTLWHRWRPLAIYAAIGAVGYFWVAAGVGDVWVGGWSFGPRLLLPVFGLLGVSGALYFEELRIKMPTFAVGAATFFLSAMVYNFFVISMFPELPPEISSPLNSVAMPLAELGAPSPNWGIVWTGDTSLESLFPAFVMLGGFVGYAGFALILREQQIPWRDKAVACAAGVLIFWSVALGYPETEDPAEVDRFVDNVAEKRSFPR